jgi:hypothetical protein
VIQRGLYYGPPDKDHYCAYRYTVAGKPRPDFRCPDDIGFYVKVPDGRGGDWRKARAACDEHLHLVIWQMQEAHGGEGFYDGDYLIRAFLPEGEEDGNGSPDDPPPVPV